MKSRLKKFLREMLPVSTLGYKNRHFTPTIIIMDIIFIDTPTYFTLLGNWYKSCP